MMWDECHSQAGEVVKYWETGSGLFMGIVDNKENIG